MESPLKDIWVQKINDSRGDWLAPKELAFILDLSEQTIYYSIRKNMKNIQRSSNGKRSSMMISKAEAIHFVLKYM